MPPVRTPYSTHRTGGLLLTLAVLAAPLLTLSDIPSRAFAAADPKQPAAKQAEPKIKPEPKPADEGPFFLGDEKNALQLASLIVSAPPVPLAGPFSALGGIYGGEDPKLKTWSLEGILTNRAGRSRAGVATLFLEGFHAAPGAPTLVALLPELAALRASDADALDCWALIDTSEVRPIPEPLLATIEDDAGIVAGSAEIDAYNQFIIQANFTSQAAFEKAAQKDVAYGHMSNEPADYRGKVVRIHGRLRRVLHVKPPFPLPGEGVNDLYIGYIINNDLGPHPYRVLFTEWPANLPRDVLGEKMPREVDVEFDGYFYKKYRYEAGDSRGKPRECPMLIGHSLRVLKMPEVVVEDTWWAYQLIYVFLGGIGVVLLIIVALTFWFRHTDSRLRRRLQATRAKDLVLPPPDAAPVAPVAAPVGGARTASRLPFPPRGTLPPGFGAGSGDRAGERPAPEKGGSKEGPDPAGPDEGAGP
jgi:hypothetical protein